MLLDFEKYNMQIYHSLVVGHTELQYIIMICNLDKSEN